MYAHVQDSNMSCVYQVEEKKETLILGCKDGRGIALTTNINDTPLYPFKATGQEHEKNNITTYRVYCIKKLTKSSGYSSPKIVICNSINTYLLTHLQ